MDRTPDGSTPGGAMPPSMQEPGMAYQPPVEPPKMDDVEDTIEQARPLAEHASLGVTGLRRLTRREAERTLADVFQVRPTKAELETYPIDLGDLTLFDNAYDMQPRALNSIEDLEEFAGLYATT